MGLFGPPNIEKLKGKRDIQGLIKALDYQKDVNLRKAAAEALGELKDIQAIQPLIAVLRNDGRVMVRQASAKALGQIGDARAVEPLLVALKDSVNDVSMTALIALDMIGWQPSLDENSAPYWVLKSEWDKCIEIGKPAVLPLIASLKNTDERVRSAATRALGQIGDVRAVRPLLIAASEGSGEATRALVKVGEPAVEELIDALKGSEPNLRKIAAEALGQIGDVRAVEPLIVRLKDTDKFVCNATARVLGEIGDVRAVEPLLRIAAIAMTQFDMDSQNLGHAALWALDKIGASAVEPLIAALNDRQDGVRAAAAKTLEKVGDGRAVEPLIAKLSDKSHFVREAAAEALGQIGDARAVPALLAARYETSSILPNIAYKALGKIGGVNAVEPLIAALKNGESRAAEALGEIGDVRAVGPLIAALKDGSREARVNAARALGAL